MSVRSFAWLGLSRMAKSVKLMRILLAIPHVFSPQKQSLYSSQNEGKRATKQLALQQSVLGNLDRHSSRHWIHASLGKNKPVITRELETIDGLEVNIQLYTPPEATLAERIGKDKRVEFINPGVKDMSKVPLVASKNLLIQSPNYDLVGYLEDDILIEDPEFFQKLLYLDHQTDGSYAFLPHRCEQIPGKGDVILSGDPDGGRPDLFWDTGETLTLDWPLGSKTFYRATNPHSGCYFLSKRQALAVKSYWDERQWISNFELSGPLEQAASGLLLPVLKVMKPKPSQYRFLMVRHQDELWKRHEFESNE